MEVKIVCPNCVLSDKIEKVSALVDSQTHQTSTYSNQEYIRTDQVSVLAQLLMPPQKPELKVRATGAIIGPHRKSSLGELGFYFNILMFGIIGIVCILASFLIVVISMLHEDGRLVYLLLGCIPFLFGLGILGFTAYYYHSSQEKLKKAETDYNEAIHKWNDLMKKWEQLFYCHRDGIVFNPVDKKIASPRNINQLYD